MCKAEWNRDVCSQMRKGKVVQDNSSFADWKKDPQSRQRWLILLEYCSKGAYSSGKAASLLCYLIFLEAEAKSKAPNDFLNPVLVFAFAPDSLKTFSL